MVSCIEPGSIIGVLGGGQLGRMFGIAARRMGYRVHVYEPTPDCPTCQVADREFISSYSDRVALAAFAASVDVITFEFENIPADIVNELARSKPTHPSADVLHTCQNREREKLFLRDNGYPHARFALIETAADLEPAIAQVGFPAVLKTADFGYDGKGQVKVTNAADLASVNLEGRAVAEEWVDFACELSAICARGQDGSSVLFPIAENVHSRHILHHSIVPARVPQDVQAQAGRIAASIAEDLNLVGLLTVEFFLTAGGRLLVNELAPRPHNSGHYSFDACVTSQFEQHLRAVTNYPLGSSQLLSPVVMVNLLGDLWRDERAPDWTTILREPRAKLHLYGKAEARPGRKMGHFCVLDDSAEGALQTALRIQAILEH